MPTTKNTTKYKDVIKKLFVILFAFVLLFGCTMLTACREDTTEVEQEQPHIPKPPEIGDY